MLCRDVGQGGRAVLMLHGAIGDERDWDLQIAALVDAGHRAIFPLRAGCGESDPYPDGVSTAREASDMLALLDQLGIDDAVLVGHSQGATVAREIYLRAPQRVAAIVSVDGFVLGKLDCKELGPSDVDARTRALFKRHGAALHDLGRPWDYPSSFNVERVRRQQSVPAERRRLRRIVDDPDDCHVPAGLFCEVPLLVFVTTRGHFEVDDARIDELRSRIPATSFRLVPVVHSGHWIHFEQAELVNRELARFVDELG